MKMSSYQFVPVKARIIFLNSFLLSPFRLFNRDPFSSGFLSCSKSSEVLGRETQNLDHN